MRSLTLWRRRRPNVGSSLPRIGRAAVAVSLLGVWLMAAPPAAADPVRIVTSGSIYQLVEDGETGASFFGSDFALTGAEVSIIAEAFCIPCTPGRTLDLDSRIWLNAFPPGSATVDGHIYDEVFYGGMLDISAGSVVVPDVPVGGPHRQMGTSFTFTGTLQGFADVTRTGTPLFSLIVTGGGRTSLGFFNYPTQNGITTDGWQFEFEQAAATPEPGSLLLFASGAAWFARRRWTLQRISRS